ncbi:MAG TPA: M56 family metallopeptidase [Dongiaceae bacterium]|nr:M56 family metallopeptidase [Dongiaceae bacterium]
MNFTAGIAAHPLAQRVGWVLLHSLWQGALVGVAFGLARHGLRRRSAEARYAAGCLALVLLAAGPAATLCLWPAPAPPGAPAAFMPVSGPPGAAARQIAEGTDSLFRMGMDLCGRLAPWLTGAWSLGVAVCLLRLMGGCWWVRRIRWRQTEPVELAWLEVLEDLRLRLEISRPVRLFQSALVQAPTVIGWLRPVILLPAAALAGLAPEQLEAILAHELAHVRRFDYLVNACLCVIETLMFYHPALWWISRCVREERENCCDDLVVQVCGNRLAYARALATLAESSAGLPELALAASGAPLLARIRRLLGLDHEGGPAGARQLGGLVLLTIGLPLILAGVCLMLVTPSFQAQARIRITKEGTGLPEPAGAPIGSGSYDPYFLQTELEVVQSQVILGRVVDQLRLQGEWGKRYGHGNQLTRLEATALLKRKISLHPVPNTTILEILAFSDTPVEAAHIANAVAEAYGEYRQRQGLTKAGLESLIRERLKQEAGIAAARTTLDNLRQTLHLSDSMASEYAPAPLITAESLRHINALRLEHEVDFIRQETLLNHLKTLKPEQLVQTLPTAAQDNLLVSFLEQKNMVDQRVQSIGVDFGSNNPTLVKVRALQADLQEKIDQRVQGIMDTLNVKVDALGKALTNLNQQVETAKEADLKEAYASQPYFDAKRNLEDLIRFRTLLENKIAAESLQDPKRIAVEIIDPAAPPARPFSPNRFLAATLLGSGLLLDLLGALMLRAARRPALQPAS